MSALRKLTREDFAEAGISLGVDAAAVEAVAVVETGGLGGFLKDGRARILAEAHEFARRTKPPGRYNATHPNISSPTWNRALYVGGAFEYVRRDQMTALDLTAGLEACSYGAFQVMGYHWKRCGYRSVGLFEQALQFSEAEQLGCFAAFVKADPNMLSALRLRAWELFARLYNGPGYAVNGYHTKIADLYAELTGTTRPAKPIVGMLRIGMRGDDRVARVQRELAARGFALVVDGDFGAGTQLAVQQFQASQGLQPDGVVGPATLGMLGLR